MATTMKLAKTTKGVLKGLGSKHSEIFDNTFETRRDAAVSPPEQKVLERPQQRERARQRGYPGKSRRPAAGKRPHHEMGHPAVVAIHEDQDTPLGDVHQLDKMRAKEMAQPHCEDGDSLDEYTSEDCDESEDEVDESVMDDMHRLEESFKGISQKYRLINRIGEGKSSGFHFARARSDSSKVLFLPFTKPSNSLSMTTSSGRMTSQKTNPMPICPLQRDGRQMRPQACPADHGGSPRLWL